MRECFKSVEIKVKIRTSILIDDHLSENELEQRVVDATLDYIRIFKGKALMFDFEKG